MLDYELRPRTQLDLESIYLYGAVTLGEPTAARSTIERLYQAFENLCALPDMGQTCEFPEIDASFQRLLIGDHWVYYTHSDKLVTIWRIFHTSQDIDNFTLVELA